MRRKTKTASKSSNGEQSQSLITGSLRPEVSTDLIPLWHMVIHLSMAKAENHIYDWNCLAREKEKLTRTLNILNLEFKIWIVRFLPRNSSDQESIFLFRSGRFQNFARPEEFVTRSPMRVCCNLLQKLQSRGVSPSRPTLTRCCTRFFLHLVPWSPYCWSLSVFLRYI